MSAPGESPPAELPRPDSGQGGCLVPLLGLIGVALLLPGICSLLFMISYLLGDRSAYGWPEVWVITLLIAAGGIALIRYALRNSVRPGGPHERP